MSDQFLKSLVHHTSVPRPSNREFTKAKIPLFFSYDRPLYVAADNPPLHYYSTLDGVNKICCGVRKIAIDSENAAKMAGHFVCLKPTVIDDVELASVDYTVDDAGNLVLSRQLNVTVISCGTWVDAYKKHNFFFLSNWDLEDV